MNGPRPTLRFALEACEPRVMGSNNVGRTSPAMGAPKPVIEKLSRRLGRVGFPFSADHAGPKTRSNVFSATLEPRQLFPGCAQRLVPA